MITTFKCSAKCIAMKRNGVTLLSTLKMTCTLKEWTMVDSKLQSFYFDALLPELASPRHRKGGIREPT